MNRSNILGIQFDLLSYQEVMKRIQLWRKNSEQHYVTLTPPHSVLMCHRDIELRKATAGAGLTLPDGVGIILAAKLLKYPHASRVTGPTLMLSLCDWGRAEGYRHFFYGGTEHVIDRLAERLYEMFPDLQVAGTYCPPFRSLNEEEDKDIVEKINSAEPDIVWVGLGSPKQEKWMAEHIGKIKAAALIGVGAAFDFHSGNVKWAPAWIRKLGLEWLYRTVREPARITPKAMDNLLFGARVLALFIKQKLGTVD